MDPDATLAIALDQDVPFDDRQRAVADLLLWIERGGWPPKMWHGMSTIAVRAHCLAMLHDA
jgi:hypothetical protein